MCSANDIEWHLMKLLDKKFKSEYPEADWNFYERKNVNVVRDILNKHCRFALNYQEEMEKADSEPMKVSYTLPDGKELKLSTELVECTERLFDPSIASKFSYMQFHANNLCCVVHATMCEQQVSVAPSQMTRFRLCRGTCGAR